MPFLGLNNRKRRRRLSPRRKFALFIGFCDLVSSCVIALYTRYTTNLVALDNPGIFENRIMKLASETHRMTILCKMVWAVGVIIIALHHHDETWQYNVEIFTIITRVIIGMKLIAVLGFAIFCSDDTQMKILQLYFVNLALESVFPKMMNVLYIN